MGNTYSTTIAILGSHNQLESELKEKVDQAAKLDSNAEVSTGLNPITISDLTFRDISALTDVPDDTLDGWKESLGQIANKVSGYATVGLDVLQKARKAATVVQSLCLEDDQVTTVKDEELAARIELQAHGNEVLQHSIFSDDYSRDAFDEREWEGEENEFGFDSMHESFGYADEEENMFDGHSGLKHQARRLNHVMNKRGRPTFTKGRRKPISKTDAIMTGHARVPMRVLKQAVCDGIAGSQLANARKTMQDADLHGALLSSSSHVAIPPREQVEMVAKHIPPRYTSKVYDTITHSGPEVGITTISHLNQDAKKESGERSINPHLFQGMVNNTHTSLGKVGAVAHAEKEIAALLRKIPFDFLLIAPRYISNVDFPFDPHHSELTIEQAFDIGLFPTTHFTSDSTFYPSGVVSGLLATKYEIDWVKKDHEYKATAVMAHGEFFDLREAFEDEGMIINAFFDVQVVSKFTGSNVICLVLVRRGKDGKFHAIMIDKCDKAGGRKSFKNYVNLSWFLHTIEKPDKKEYGDFHLAVAAETPTTVQFCQISIIELRLECSPISIPKKFISNGRYVDEKSIFQHVNTLAPTYMSCGLSNDITAIWSSAVKPLIPYIPQLTKGLMSPGKFPIIETRYYLLLNALMQEANPEHKTWSREKVMKAICGAMLLMPSWLRSNGRSVFGCVKKARVEMLAVAIFSTTISLLPICPYSGSSPLFKKYVSTKLRTLSSQERVYVSQ